MEKERRIVLKKGTSKERKKNEAVLIIAFVLLLIVAGGLFYFLYLKPPPSQKPSTGTETQSRTSILKEYKITDLEDELTARYMDLPPIETTEEELGKEDPFSP
ncbi:MAG TPA: hypothetical protein ENG37_00265 [Firmicutes bacterium]|nr:hypothetical protein [Bacillota bacterium]